MSSLSLPSSPIYNGIVQFVHPSAGFAVVTTTGPYAIDKTVICRLQTPGGIIGAGLLQAPVTGTTVSFTNLQGTDKYYIVSSNPQGLQPSGKAQNLRLHSHDKVPAMSFWSFVDSIIQFVEKFNKGKQRATANVGLQDQYEGDLYLGDKQGPGVFTGRAQITVKGSETSYIEMASLDDKINVVTVEAQLASLSDKITISNNLNKKLKASGALQGLGGRARNKDKYPLQLTDAEKPSTLKFSDNALQPVFRTQSFQGGAARGTYKTIVCPDEKDRNAVVMSQMDTYDGTGMKFYAQGTCSIKTTAIPGLVERPLQNPKTSLAGMQEIDDRQTEARKIEGMRLSQNGLQRALQLNQLLKDDQSKALLAGMLGAGAIQLINEQVEPYTASLKSNLDWQGKTEMLGDMLGDGPTASDKQTYSGTDIKRFLNSSIITQDPDGSITLKDGWGSQITMSHGNIYISSALDTFIRPGRDLIQLVPRHLSATAQNQIELAAKKDVKIGAQKNLVMASAISGQEGYTVLQNRSRKQGNDNGMVIRSNGKLTLTSSDDMHIGINDKKLSNKGSSATYGNGSIFIEGQKLRLQSRGQLLLTGTDTGIYSIKNKTGAGIQIRDNIVTTVGSAIYLDTGNIKMGNFQTSYTVRTGNQEDEAATLSKGQGTLTVHIRGQLQSRGVTVAGSIMSSGQLLAQKYSILQETELKEIPGVKDSFIKQFRSSLRQLFNSPLKNAAVNYNAKQDWYNDNFICNKELTFMDTWNVSYMPTMCWQVEAQDGFKKLKGISVKATGGEQKQTYTYPGSAGWKDGRCYLSEITDKKLYTVQYNKPITQAYTTYTKEGE